MGIDLNRESAPDATTLLKFRRQLEKHQLTERIFTTINTLSAAKCLILKEGTFVDATIIAAPSSTRNQNGDRDQQMQQTKKSKQWHFGMKAHIGVNAATGIIHTLATTPANTHDITQAHTLLHGQEKTAWGDAGYQGIEKRQENKSSTVKWEVAMRPGKHRALPDTQIRRFQKRLEYIKAKCASQSRASVSHREKPLWHKEGALQGTGEEHRTILHAVWSGKSGDSQAEIVCDQRPR